MKSNKNHHIKERGVTLVELMVTLAITLFLVSAAGYVYLNTRETQRSIDQNGSTNEVGSFVLELIGHEIMMAGYYPANVSRISANEPMPKLTWYPPTKLLQNATTATDWTLPAPIYSNGLFGCDGAKFNPSTGTCGTPVNNAPDSIVINYFTTDTMDASVGHHSDCTGASIENDTTNTNRIGTSGNFPLQPLFISNRFGINSTNIEVEKNAITTGSLACNGNGASGSKPNPATATIKSGTSSQADDVYQPIIPGIEDLQITYGVFAATSYAGQRTPDKFYTASQVTNNLLPVLAPSPPFDLISVSPWSRVVAVRVCVLTKSLAQTTRISDKSGSARTYVDCQDTTQTASDSYLRKRFVQVFAVRNRLNQVF